MWLNTPRRPQEASGTSGMKASLNGGLNVSILDGWWCEGFTAERGWAIGHGEEYEDSTYEDNVEAQALYNVLEEEVIPCFYERTSGDIPQRWVRMMKESMKMGLGLFTSHRMVAEYNNRFYQPAMSAYHAFTSDGYGRAKDLVKQQQRLRALWPSVRVDSIPVDHEVQVRHVGDEFSVQAAVRLGDLTPNEVDVQAYFGPLDSNNVITESHVQPMERREDKGNGAYVYACNVVCRSPGRYGFTARAIPRGDEWKTAIPGYMTWADGV